MIRDPKPATLAKYGMDLSDWRSLLERQGGACWVCEKEPGSGRLCVDHDHVKGFKKMPPERRRLFVRGLLCWVCNHYYLGRGITIAKAERVALYLKAYAARHSGDGGAMAASPLPSPESVEAALGPACSPAEKARRIAAAKRRLDMG